MVVSRNPRHYFLQRCVSDQRFCEGAAEAPFCSELVLTSRDQLSKPSERAIWSWASASASVSRSGPASAS